MVALSGSLPISSSSKPTIGIRFVILALLYSNVAKVIFGSWATIISDFVIIAALLFKTNERWNKDRSISMLFLFGGSFSLIIISIFEILNPNIINRVYSLIEFRKTFFQMLAIYVGYSYLNDSSDVPKTIDETLKFILIASTPLMLYGVKQFVAFDQIDVRLYQFMDSAPDTNRYGQIIRSISFFSGPFHYGMFCVLQLSISLYLRYKRMNVQYYIFSIISIAGVICSYTRTNIACAIIVCAVFILFGSKDYDSKSIPAYKILFGVIVVGIAAILLLSQSGYVDLGNEQINSIINSILHATEDSRLTNRFITWNEAYALFLEKPFLGYGMGSAGDTMAAHGIAYNWVTPHNAFIKVAVEMGMIGLILFLLVCISALNISLFVTRGKLAARGLLISICILLACNMMFGSTLGSFPVMTLIYLILGQACKEYEHLHSASI